MLTPAPPPPNPQIKFVPTSKLDIVSTAVWVRKHYGLSSSAQAYIDTQLPRKRLTWALDCIKSRSEHNILSKHQAPPKMGTFRIIKASATRPHTLIPTHRAQWYTTLGNYSKNACRPHPTFSSRTTEQNGSCLPHWDTAAARWATMLALPHSQPFRVAGERL